MVTLDYQNYQPQYIHLNDTQNNNKSNATLGIMALYTEFCYADCLLRRASFMQSLANKNSILNVIMLSVVMLSVTVQYYHIMTTFISKRKNNLPEPEY